MSTVPRAPHHSSTTLRRVGTFSMIAVVATAGLLIWGRLRLVTGVPRTALAEPRQPAKTGDSPALTSSIDDEGSPEIGDTRQPDKRAVTQSPR